MRILCVVFGVAAFQNARKQKTALLLLFLQGEWSVMQDSNLRPLGPKPSALPSCANHRLRYTTATGRNITAQPLERQTFFAAKKLIA